MVDGMWWQVMLSTFATVFMAELGDKTQLATLSIAAGSDSRWAVFVGAALALIATTAVAVLAGEALPRVVPLVWLRRAAGALMIVLGIFFVVRA